METVDNLLEALSLIRREIRELEHKENYVKTRIFQMMDDNDANQIYTPSYMATRTFQRRETMSKKNTPRAIWDQYSTVSEYPQLNIRPH